MRLFVEDGAKLGYPVGTGQVSLSGTLKPGDSHNQTGNVIMKSFSLAFVILATILTGLPGQVQARNYHVLKASQNRYQSLDQAVQKIKRKTGGRILSAKTVGKKHVIKVLLPSGKVRVFRVNAR